MSYSLTQGFEADVVIASPMDIRTDAQWRCPACTFSAAAPDVLAAHVRFIHVTPRFEEDSSTSWKCSLHECRRSRRSFTGPNGLAKHLEAHALAMRPRRRRVEQSPFVESPLVSPVWEA